MVATGLQKRRALQLRYEGRLSARFLHTMAQNDLISVQPPPGLAPRLWVSAGRKARWFRILNSPPTPPGSTGWPADNIPSESWARVVLPSHHAGLLLSASDK